MLAPVRTVPPTYVEYSPEIDRELFRVSSTFRSFGWKSSISLGGQLVRREREVWAYETTSTEDTYYDDRGVLRAERVEFSEPRLTEIPRYTYNTEDAVSFKNAVLGFGRRLLIEEIEQKEELSLWRAKIIDASDLVVGQGETYDCAASVIVVVLSDLLANEHASYWSKVVNDRE